MIIVNTRVIIMNTSFDHEKLSVYQESIKFVVWSDEIKAILVRIVSMLVGLIRSTSPDRVHEDKASYVTRNEKSD